MPALHGFHLVVAFSVVVMTCSSGETENRRAIGGAWTIESGRRFPESGITVSRLVRTDGGRSRVVADGVENHRFYEPDCVVFQTASTHSLFAVCDERAPIAIENSSVVEWELLPEGPSRIRGMEVRDGKAIQVVERFPLADIQSLAMSQPEFRAKLDDDARFDPEAATLQVVREEHPIDPNMPAPELRVIFGRAIAAGDTDLVAALVSAGADVNVADEQGATSLMVAAGAGRIEIVEVLIRSGADLNTQNKFGETALMYAAGTGEVPAVRRLLEAGADATIRDAKGRTVLDRASGGRNEEMLRLLGQAITRE